MNTIFVAMIVVAFAMGAWTGQMDAMTREGLEAAKRSVELAIGLTGYMTLFLGLMKIADEAGLLRLTARAIRPIMVRLFPEVPADHPAMGAMILNIASNLVGLTNAATPLGIKAMQELQKLNKVPGVATNAMCLFLAINTAGFDLLPSGVVSARAGAGSADPWGIAGSTLFATGAATVAGVVVCKLAERFNLWPAGPPQGESVTEDKPDSEVVSKLLAAEAAGDTWGVWVVRGVMLLVMGAMGVPPLMAMALGPESDAGKHYISLSSTVGSWVIPSMFVLLVAYGVARGIEVYPTFVKGAKEGFSTGVMIIPYLVAILVAVALFRASGAMDYVTALGAVTGPLGLPGEVLPMAVVRPLSGSGAYAMLIDLLQKHGPDSFIGYVASTLQGSTDTTFYVIAVYFGSVGVTRGRHAIAAGLAADIAGVVATAVICRYLFASLMP